MNPPERWRVVAAFAAIYFLWGSSYLFIRFAVETLPPFLMAGTEQVVAGSLLYLWAHLRGAPRPRGFHWKAALIVGGLFSLGGIGGLAWAEQRVPSGLAALLIATDAFWMVLLDWASGGARPSARVTAGIVGGFAGVALLVLQRGPLDYTAVDPIGAAAVLLASLLWAAGSIYSRRARLPASLPLATAMNMLAGGALLLALGLASGELTRLAAGRTSLRSALSLAYLIVFPSLLGSNAYLWLLRVTTPARVSTYAYVHPMVAVFLGWALAAEPLGLRTLVAMAIIVASVALVK